MIADDTLKNDRTGSATANLIQRIRQTSLRWRVGILVLGALLVVGIFFLPRPELDKESVESAGYSGVFLVTLIANATVILPTPGFLAVIVAGAVLNPFLVAVSAAAGMTLGETSAYLIGRGGRALSSREFRPDVGERKGIIDRGQRLIDRWGMLGILILAATPNPLFDLAGIAAGAAQMGIVKFLAATFVGRLIRTLLLAYGSAYSVQGITDLLS